jgi:hypothetical protein
LAQRNSDAYLPKVANTLNNLEVLLGEQNRLDEARQDLEEALGIYQSFAERFGKDI